MHYTAGLILSLVFQLAHVMDDAEMPVPDKKTGVLKNSWAISPSLKNPKSPPLFFVGPSEYSRTNASKLTEDLLAKR